MISSRQREGPKVLLALCENEFSFLQASFLYDCVARIKEEMAEERDDGSENGTAAGQSDEFSSL